MATLTRLEPDTEYDWRVKAGDTTKQGERFKTMPAPPPFLPPDLKTYQALFVKFHKANKAGDAKAERSALIALSKFAKGIGQKYDLPFE